jgi:elongation factor Ts
MAAITAQMVKDLRDRTDAGMMDCKKALVEADGDMDAAVEVLRKAGIAKAAKKAGRAATEGRILTRIEEGAAAMVEVLCETDFVARNEKFATFAQGVVDRIIDDCKADGDVSEQVNENEKQRLVELVAVIGENMQLRRAVRWNGGKFASYLHMGGRIGVLIEAEGTEDETLLNDVCMHIAAFSPRYITPADIPAEAIAKEKEIAQAQVQGKPENIIDKIVSGKIEKWYGEVCLTRQPWLRDDKTCLAKLVPNLKIKRFLRWAVGEAI